MSSHIQATVLAVSFSLCFACSSNAPARRTSKEPLSTQVAEQDKPGDDADAQPGASSATLSPPVKLAPPVPVPVAGDNGCVAPDVHAKFVKALAALKDESVEQALARDGATLVERQGDFVERRVGDVYTAKGKRFAVVTQMDSYADARVSLARKKSGSLHMLQPRAREHQVIVPVCGVNPCRYGRGARILVRSVAIELKDGESVGAPLSPEFDFWWVFPTYSKQRNCGPPPP